MFLGESVITEEKKKSLFEAFGWLNQFLEKSKYVAGDNVTIADLSIIATVSGMIVSRRLIFTFSIVFLDINLHKYSFMKIR